MGIETSKDGFSFRVYTKTEKRIFERFVGKYVRNEEALNVLGISAPTSNAYGSQRNDILIGRKLLSLDQWYKTLRETGLADPSASSRLYHALTPNDLKPYKYAEEDKMGILISDFIIRQELKNAEETVDMDKIPLDLNEFGRL